MKEEQTEGGALKKVRIKSPVKDRRKEKVDDALKSQIKKGGNLKQVRVRSPKKDKRKEKVDEALEKQAKSGGKLPKRKYNDAIHKHLMQNLSGRGGHLDSPFVRQKVHEVMTSYHPSLFSSYMKGRAHVLPQHQAFHAPTAKISRPDTKASVTAFGGSLSAITHSENGRLMSHNSAFIHHVELH